MNTGAVIMSGASGTGNAEEKKRNDHLGKDEFLKLLVTQLRYQDPLEPMKDQEFIAQMAQFSALEQMQQLNKSFESMLMLQDMAITTQTITQTFSLIGSKVDAYLPELDEVISGTVERVKMVKGWPVLIVNGIEIDIDEIIQISRPTVEGENDGQEDHTEQSVQLA